MCGSEPHGRSQTPSPSSISISRVFVGWGTGNPAVSNLSCWSCKCTGRSTTQQRAVEYHLKHQSCLQVSRKLPRFPSSLGTCRFKANNSLSSVSSEVEGLGKTPAGHHLLNTEWDILSQAEAGCRHVGCDLRLPRGQHSHLAQDAVYTTHHKHKATAWLGTS